MIHKFSYLFIGQNKTSYLLREKIHWFHEILTSALKKIPLTFNLGSTFDIT